MAIIRGIRGIRSEFIKLRHTAVPLLHIFIPTLGAAGFLLYFALYPRVEATKKLALVLELTAIVFPIVIGVVCGLMAALEEKAASFGVMLGSKDGRIIPYLSKLLTAVFLGILATIALTLLTMLGVFSLSLATISVKLFLTSAIGMFIGYMPLYIIHQFLSIKWGLSVSVFVAVIESLLAVMFSNVDSALWVFFPATWGGKVLKTVLHGTSLQNTSMNISAFIVASIFLVMLIFSFVWFQRWEGRKTAE